MTEQEKINADVQMKLAMQDAKFSVFMQELKEQREDIRELRQDMKDIQKSFDSKIDRLDAKIDDIGKHVRNLSLTAMGAIGAMVVTVIVSLLKH